MISSNFCHYQFVLASYLWVRMCTLFYWFKVMSACLPSSHHASSHSSERPGTWSSKYTTHSFSKLPSSGYFIKKKNGEGTVFLSFLKFHTSLTGQKVRNPIPRFFNTTEPPTNMSSLLYRNTYLQTIEQHKAFLH